MVFERFKRQSKVKAAVRNSTSKVSGSLSTPTERYLKKSVSLLIVFILKHSLYSENMFLFLQIFKKNLAHFFPMFPFYTP